MIGSSKSTHLNACPWGESSSSSASASETVNSRVFISLVLASDGVLEGTLEVLGKDEDEGLDEGSDEGLDEGSDEGLDDEVLGTDEGWDDGSDDAVLGTDDEVLEGTLEVLGEDEDSDGDAVLGTGVCKRTGAGVGGSDRIGFGVGFGVG
jgi:hypothetical protein